MSESPCSSPETPLPPVSVDGGERAAVPTIEEVVAWMEVALEEAAQAIPHGDVPVGAVVVDESGRVVARRHNERERRGDPTAHAEILALQDAAAGSAGWRLSGATVVVTLEPCPMCAGALLAARVRRVVFGAPDPKAGSCGSLYNLCCDPRLSHEIEVIPEVRAEECGRLLRDFFSERRRDDC